MFRYLLCATIIVFLVWAVYWYAAGGQDRSKRSRARILMESSSGTFDNSAQQALQSLTQIENPTPTDRFRRGSIFQYNMLEGNIRGRGETRVARRHRQEIVGRLVRDYTDALEALHDNTTAVETYIQPGFMVDRIEYMNWMLQGGDDVEIQGILLGFNNTVNTHAPQVRKELASRKRERAIAESGSRAEAIDKYFDSIQVYTDDRQNVHDSKVNGDLRETLEKLKSSVVHVDANQSIIEAMDYIENVYALQHRDKTVRIANALNKIREGSTISTFDESEDSIFAYVWERCNHPRNAGNREAMREAIMDSLADCTENGNLVCINGRCARLLGSLVTLDFDRDVGSAMTLEAYKNQIFQETKDIISREIENAKSSNDPRVRAVGEMYEGGAVDADDDLIDEFKQIIKGEIDANLERYEAKLNALELGNIKQDCYVYATI